METVPDIHRAHREEFEQFALAQAEPWHREYLTAPLCGLACLHRRYFQGA